MTDSEGCACTVGSEAWCERELEAGRRVNRMADLFRAEVHRAWETAATARADVLGPNFRLNLATALHDADCGCEDWGNSETEQPGHDPRYIDAADKALSYVGATRTTVEADTRHNSGTAALGRLASDVVVTPVT